MKAGLAALVAAGGCNWAFGIEHTNLEPPDDATIRPDVDPRADVDYDGIKDVDDPCIAPETDLLVDSDYDQLPNAQDPCPFDARSQADADGDGIGDLCDPNPQTPGDRVRCIIAFSDPDLDNQIWNNRDEPPGWVLLLPRALQSQHPFGTASASWPLEAPAPLVTTIQTRIRMYSPAASFKLQVRVGATPADDVGCSVTPLSTGWLVGTSTGAQVQSTFTTGPSTVSVVLAATFVATANASLRCTASIHTAPPVYVESMVALRPGTMGITAASFQSVDGFVIYERDDAAP